MSNEEIIVQVGAEGGDVALYGVRTDDGWLFSLNVYDCSLLLLDEDEGGAVTQHRSSPVTSWSDALALLDRKPWARLHPLAVHREFRKKVWNEVQRRLGHNEDDHRALTQWREICEVDTENWLDSYYGALEFFYWEPQHMRAKTHAATELKTLKKIVEQPSKIETIRIHLRKMEVTLNHNIQQFFLLAPDSFRNDLFEQIFDHKFEDAFVMYGHDAKFSVDSWVQPDLLFASAGQVISVEMKVNPHTKCSIDQVLKYALLGLAIEMREEVQKEHYLVLLGKGTFDSFFTERFDSIKKLTDAIATADLTSFLHTKRRFRDCQERFDQIVKQMHIEFINYKNLAVTLGNAASPEADQSLGAEVYRKAIFGLVDEFTRRQLL